MKIFTTIVVCALMLVLIGCSSEQTPTEVSGIPVEDITKVQPENTGATIVRYEGGFAANYYDFRRELQVVIGVDMPTFCGGVFEPDIVNIMDITHPNDQNIINQLFHGSDMYCWVYPLYEFDCERFLSEGPIASGFVDLVSTDNDVIAWVEEASSNNRVNAYKTSAHGTLYTPDGQEVQINFQSQLVWTGWPDEEFIHSKNSIIMATRGP